VEEEKMTVEQMETFIYTAQLGMACGLSHPLEWYVNHINHMMNMYPYDTVATKEKLLTEAFVEFYKNTAGSPEEDDWLNELTVGNFNERIVEPYYDYYRKQWSDEVK
jgi:hypothetical protein